MRRLEISQCSDLQVMAVPAEHADPVAIALADHPITVVLDLVLALQAVATRVGSQRR
jgi:hypothetical protein